MESSDSVWISCRSGDFRSFYELLRGNPSLIAARDAGGHTPLHWFALANNIDAVKKILQLGAEVTPKAALYGVAQF